MSEMIERVAMAMSMIYDGVDLWDVKSEHGTYDYLGKEDFRGMARAAIEAMRKPTQVMADAGASTWGPNYAYEDEVRENIVREYEAMIDAALEAKP